MSHNDIQLSKVSDLMKIRKNMRHHAFDIICRVISMSKDDKRFKYFNCSVVDDENVEKKFSFKITGDFLAGYTHIGNGDIIVIKKALKGDNRRSSSAYVFKADDLIVQLLAGKDTSADVLFSTLNGEVNIFNLLSNAKNYVTLRGFVDCLPHKHDEKWIFMLADSNDNVIEIELQNFAEIKVGDQCIAYGNILKDGVNFFMMCKKVTKIDPMHHGDKQNHSNIGQEEIQLELQEQDQRKIPEQIQGKIPEKIQQQIHRDGKKILKKNKNKRQVVKKILKRILWMEKVLKRNK